MRTAKSLSDWADAQADLSVRWTHIHFVGFVMRWLNYKNNEIRTVRLKLEDQ